MELLIKDLCARLPYGVRVSLTEPKRDDSASEFSYRGGRFLTGILYAVYPQENRVIIDELSEPIAQYNVRCGGFDIDECSVRPYLRPMSGMTEEEWLKLKEWIFIASDTKGKINFDGFRNISAEDTTKAIDYLISHHFDYRGLIPMELALVAPEGMYKTE